MVQAQSYNSRLIILYCSLWPRSFFVTELMLQTGPEVHGNGADLDLRPHRSLSLGEEYRDLHDHMIAAVAVVFGIPDIIFNTQDCNIVLIGQQFCHDIDIIDKRTDHPYAGHIIELFFDILFGKVIAQTLQLVVDA